jgi:acyl-CoA thioesterase FadM
MPLGAKTTAALKSRTAHRMRRIDDEMRAYRRSVLRTRVRFGETDAAGLVFHPSYVGWFDARIHPIRYDEPVEIVSTIAEIGESSLRVELEVRHRDAVAARGFEGRVYVAAVDGRVTKARIPDELRAHLTG